MRLRSLCRRPCGCTSLAPRSIRRSLPMRSISTRKRPKARTARKARVRSRKGASPIGSCAEESAMPRLVRTYLGHALLVAAALFAFASGAQAEYPDHPIKAVVPFPPAGGTDIFARLVSQHLSKVLGQ